MSSSNIYKGKLRNKIARDGWNGFLEGMRVNETSTIFSYLARTEGRKGAQDKFSCSTPLMDPVTSNLIFRSKDKVSLLATHFTTKFNKPPPTVEIPLSHKNKNKGQFSGVPPSEAVTPPPS